MAGNKQKHHPNFQLTLRRIQECNGIKYAAYRTAAKLRILQRTLNSDNLRLGVIAGVFERHKLLVTENSVQLDYNELESVISDIYFVLQKEVLYDLDTSLATELMLNFLFLVFDSQNKKQF